MSDACLRENVVIITGASSGIGRALSLQLAEKNAWLTLAARDADRLENVVRDCYCRGGRAIAVKTDIAIKADCRTLIDKTVSEYGRIDTLINNAGISMKSSFDQLQDLSLLEDIMRVNYLGAAYVTYYALSYLKLTCGRIVAVSSLAGKKGIATYSGYAASKHAMVGFFNSLRTEIAETGVSVTLIYPGFVASEIHERAFGADGKPLGKRPVSNTTVMTAEECARIMINAIVLRKREEVITLYGKMGRWLKRIPQRTWRRPAN